MIARENIPGVPYDGHMLDRCLSKVQYPDPYAARRQLAMMLRSKRIPEAEKARLAMYRCVVCDRWHLGRRVSG